MAFNEPLSSENSYRFPGFPDREELRGAVPAKGERVDGCHDDTIYNRWLESIRGLRHDFMNDIQVLASYLVLHKVEEGRRFVEELTQRMEQESLLIQLDYAPLVVYLMTYNYQQDILRLEVELDRSFSLTDLSVRPQVFFRAIQRWLDIYRRHAITSKKETAPSRSLVKESGRPLVANHLMLRMRSLHRDLEVTFDYVGCLEAEPSLREIRDLMADLEQTGFRCTEGLHSCEESVMKMTVPFA
jgi:hypothetical protein